MTAAAIVTAADQELHPPGAIVLHYQEFSPGLELAHYRHPPDEMAEEACEQHLILINTDVPPGTTVEQIAGGRSHIAQMQLEDIIILPAQLPTAARWNQEHSYLTIAIDPQTFEQRLGEAIAGHSVELTPQVFLPDALLHHIGKVLVAELSTSGFGGQLYLDTLLTTIAVHLLRNYCVQTPLPAPISAGLPNYKLRQVLDYIQAHLDRDLRLADLAAIAQVSPNYFAAQFKQSTGLAPHQYVIAQRIEQAKALLKQMAIADVALQVGFAHQSHFTRHFKRLVGLTPKQFINQQ